ncbi:NADPH-dependent FMN reductase [Auraticoccus cholistanensis]|nr:NAD(P)H-dependent oxidoreductase [Auraticoccus cholistanensis]
MPTTVLGGDPRPGSRTLLAARRVAAALDPDEPATETELAALTREVLDPSSPHVVRALARLREADLAVVATPSCKGSFSGLLKGFLDHLPAGGLSGVTVVPVVVAASNAHLVRTQLHLGDVLGELGADLLSGFSAHEQHLDRLDVLVEEWLDLLGTDAVLL